MRLPLCGNADVVIGKIRIKLRIIFADVIDNIVKMPLLVAYFFKYRKTKNYYIRTLHHVFEYRLEKSLIWKKMT